MNTAANAILDQEISSQALADLLAAQRASYAQNPMPSAAERRANLARLRAMALDNQDALMEAMNADFSARSRHEMLLAEFLSVSELTKYLSKRLAKWMKPEKRHLALHMQPGKARVYYQPLGVVGIMVPFNYPLFLALGPLATALAAGNHAMIKMPEATPKTSALLAELIAQTFSPAHVTVINGGPAVAANFSALPFDHLLFTGAGSIGKHVMRAAAENLTPVTLELGGKSPVIVADDFPIEEAARRLCFSKTMNCGQTCVAPDYIFVPRAKMDTFRAAYKKAFSTFYPTVNNNPDLTGVISERHAQRLQGWVEAAKAQGALVEPVTDEVVNDGSRRTVPLLVTNVNRDMTLMQEEIFGPVLPLIPYDSLQEAIDYINGGDRPLALYYFGFDKQQQQQVLDRTHSGGVVFNETMFHVAVDDLPFGGVGPSGMGHYHGKEGFLTFSKPKAVLYKPKFNGMQMLYPPYGGLVNKILKFLVG
ncbi:coniferyl aldehyde dehydrogenase [Simiduia agarivorans]|uniref:Aldehyde dehydrogenase n=1 Tax=Simiduia agarivorans (strain DSM 21679 / JCM 13881 / BCRC 17597 / SA1) TaxID=1117647 RepID=R9S5J4_SIMAS|nr:coniferyl aldehyde dehydrogenase [Simiduia agarivorans]AGN11264.1 aldehyde dehydrogenase [Simiduia agarivorans SA1 = DSM 21679]